MNQQITKETAHQLFPTLPMYATIEGWVIDYPEINKLVDEQMHVFWPHDEPTVDNDIQDLMIRLTPGELNGITETLRLFTIYERRVGEDYWIGRICRTFNRPEFQRMGTMFGAVEENSHAPFYNKVNEVLYLNTPEFYNSWKERPELRERIKFVGQSAAHEDDAMSFAAFTFIEGAVLYSSFAFLKHFQEEKCGKDLMKNICRGIDLSVGDEHQHSIGGAMLFHTLCREFKEKYNFDIRESHRDDIIKMAHTVFEHESAIIDIIFEKGDDIKGITKAQLREFVKHRINLCLENLGYEPIFVIEDDFIQKWFYRSINSKKLTDFFTGSGSEYNIKYDRNRFGSVWAN